MTGHLPVERCGCAIACLELPCCRRLDTSQRLQCIGSSSERDILRGPKALREELGLLTLVQAHRLTRGLGSCAIWPVVRAGTAVSQWLCMLPCRSPSQLPTSRRSLAWQDAASEHHPSLHWQRGDTTLQLELDARPRQFQVHTCHHKVWGGCTHPTESGCSPESLQRGTATQVKAG